MEPLQRLFGREPPAAQADLLQLDARPAAGSGDAVLRPPPDGGRADAEPAGDAFFAFRLADVKRAGLREYGLLASRYAAEFRQKWLLGGEKTNETLLGNADVQSLADLANSYDVVREVRFLPFSKGLVLRLAVLLALPLSPLLLTMIPFEEMMNRLVKLVL